MMRLLTRNNLLVRLPALLVICLLGGGVYLALTDRADGITVFSAGTPDQGGSGRVPAAAVPPGGMDDTSKDGADVRVLDIWVAIFALLAATIGAAHLMGRSVTGSSTGRSGWRAIGAPIHSLRAPVLVVLLLMTTIGCYLILNGTRNPGNALVGGSILALALTARDIIGRRFRSLSYGPIFVAVLCFMALGMSGLYLQNSLFADILPAGTSLFGAGMSRQILVGAQATAVVYLLTTGFFR